MLAPKPSGRPPAMTDVAALAGVSHQTVSRVLNNTGRVRPETRERVMAAINELGYRRNEIARALVTSRSRLIGVVTAADVNYGPSQTLCAIELAAQEAGYYVSVSVLPELSEKALREALDTLLGIGAAGIVVIAPITEIAEQLGNLNLEVPLVAVSSTRDTDSPSVTYVGVNQRDGARSAVIHLLKQGCTSVAHLAGPENWFDATEREAGWRDALESTGVERGPLLRGGWDATSGYQLTKQLLQDELPDAIFAANDQLALGSLYALSTAGIQVPEQIRVVGFDDEPSSAYFSTPLTTVKQNFEDLGRAAIDSLTARTNGSVAQDILIPTSLVVRQSA